MADLTLDALLEIEHRGWDALCRSEGGAFYGDLMTPEALMVLVNGAVLDRPTIARTLDDAPPWSSYALTSPRLVPTGPAAAALVYRATATRAGQAEPFVALMTSHYCDVGGATRLALYQQTTVTHQG
jgi:hypothetical protein